MISKCKTINIQDDAQQSEIIKVVNDLDKNQNFAYSLPFRLMRLKSKLDLSNINNSINNSIEMLNNNIILIFNRILLKQIKTCNTDESLIITIGEIIYKIVNILFNDTLNNHYYLLVNEHKILELSKEMINNIDIKNVVSFKLFLTIYQRFIMFDIIKNNNYGNIENNMKFLITLINKGDSSEDISYSVLNVIKEICENEKFIYVLMKEEQEFSNKIFIKEVIISINNSTYGQSALVGIQILDIILNVPIANNNINEVIKETIDKPILFFISIITKFRTNSIIQFILCKVLAKLIQKEDINSLILFLQSHSIEEITNNINVNESKSNISLLKDIKYAFNTEENNINLEPIYKNVTRVLFIMHKDKEIYEMITNNSNLLEHFIDLLRDDITELVKENNINIKEPNRSSIIELVKLNITLLKNYSFDKSDKDNKVIKTICYSFLKVLELFPENDENVIYDILYFFDNKSENNEIKMNYIFSLFEEIDKEEKNVSTFNNIKNKELISNNIAERVFIQLISYSYKQKWIYSFLHKYPINLIYPTIFNSNNIQDHNSILHRDLLRIQKEIKSIQEIYRNETASNMFYLINSISFKLIVGNTLPKDKNIGIDNLYSNNSSFDIFTNVIECLINIIINPKSIEIYNDKNCCYIITLLFSSIENNYYAENKIKEKCELVIKLIKRFNDTKTFTFETLSYLSNRLNSLIELKLDPIKKDIFNNECLCYYILNAMNKYIQSNKDENYIKEILILLYHMLIHSKDSKQLIKFIQQNGMLLIIKIIYNNTISTQENITMLIKDIQLFSSKNFRDIIFLFKNLQTLKKICNEIKTIKFSNGINDNIYYELYSFIRNIFNSVTFFEMAEDIQLPLFFVQEFIDISNFDNDAKGNSLFIIADIISIMCQSPKLLLSFNKTPLFNQITSIIDTMAKSNKSKENFNSRLFESIYIISFSFFKILNEKDPLLTNIYNSKIYNLLYENLNIMIIEHMNDINDLSKLFSYIETVLGYENYINSDIETRIFPIDFFRNFLMQFEQIDNTNASNATAIKEEIDKCIQSIENPSSCTSLSKITINEENVRMMKELISLTTEKKTPARGKASEHPEMEKDSSLRNSRRGTCTISNNPMIKNYYDKIVSNFCSLIKEITNKFLAKENYDQQTRDLLDCFMLLKLFIKDNDNIEQMVQSDLINKLIIVIETDSIFTLECQKQSFYIFEKITTCENATSYLISNNQFIVFLFREMKRVINKLNSESELSSFALVKSCTIMKIMGHLNEERDFVNLNIKKFNTDNIYDILYNVKTDKIIIVHMLKILKNVIIHTQELKTKDEINRENDKLCDLLMKVLWPRYENEIAIIKMIISIIEGKYTNEDFILLLEKNKLIEFLCKVFTVGKIDKLKKHSEGFLSVLILMNKLTIYTNIIDSLVEIAIQPVMKSVQDNMFNSQIVEESFKLFVSCGKANDKYIDKICIMDMKELTVQIINKFVTTIHVNIVKLTIELIWLFMKDKDKEIVSFYSDSMNNLVKAFKFHIKNFDITNLVFDIVNQITEYEIDRLNRDTINSDDKENNSNEDDNIDVTPGENTTINTYSHKTKHSKNKKDNITYNIEGIFAISSEIFKIYAGNAVIQEKLYQLLINISKIAQDESFKKSVIDIIINNTNKYVEGIKEQRDEDTKIINMLCNTLIQLMSYHSLTKNTDFSLIIYLLSRIVVKFQVNTIITKKILGLLFLIEQEKKNNIINFIEEINEIFKWFRNLPNESLCDSSLELFLSILTFICQQQEDIVDKFVKDNLIFALEKLKDTKNCYRRIESVLPKICELSPYYSIPDNETAIQIKEILLYLLENFKVDNKIQQIILIFKIINGFFHRSQLLQIELEKEKTFIPNLKEYIANSNIRDPLLDYSIKSYEMSLKTKVVNYNSMHIEKKMTINKEELEKAKGFVIKERTIVFYNEYGEHMKCFFKSSEQYDNFIAYEKNKKNEITKKLDSINIKEIDSCVRRKFNFKKRWKLFSRKPKAKFCFSIIRVKEMNKKSLSINIECEDEDTCIKYVDSISILIKAYKEEHKS